MCPIKSTKSFWSANIRIRLSFFNSSLPVVVMAADSWGEVLLNESFPLIVLCHGRGHLISSTGTWGKLPGNGNMEHTSTNFHKNYQAFIIRKLFEKISLLRKQNSMPRLKYFITNISLGELRHRSRDVSFSFWPCAGPLPWLGVFKYINQSHCPGWEYLNI